MAAAAAAAEVAAEAAAAALAAAVAAEAAAVVSDWTEVAAAVDAALLVTLENLKSWGNLNLAAAAAASESPVTDLLHGSADQKEVLIRQVVPLRRQEVTVKKASNVTCCEE